MKRVLIFSLTYHPFIGGAEIAIKEITDRIDSNDIQFDMITLRFDSELPRFERIGNVNVYRIGFTLNKTSMADLVRLPLVLNKYLFPILALRKAKRLHRDHAYDAIWAMMANYAGFAAVFFKMKFPKVPFLLTLQEGDPIEYIERRVRFVYPLFEKIFTQADSVQAISHYLADFARSMGCKGTVAVVPNGVDTSLFSQRYPESELKDLKKTLRVEPGTRFMIHTGRFVLKNALDDVIKALPLLPDDIHFLAPGSGPDEASLKKLAQRLNVSNRVHFVGQIDNRELPKYLKVSDVFVRPSLSEGMGISFIEAMAAGIPVIATPVGGIVDFLFDSDTNTGKEPTGLFCEVRNPQSIARQVNSLLGDNELYEKVSKNAYQLVTESYDWKIIVPRMREIFKRLGV